MRIRVFCTFLAILLLPVLVAMPRAAHAYYAAFVLNETTGQVMYARSADEQLSPASLTKIMTLYMIFEEIDAGRLTEDTPMKVSRVAASRSPVKLNLRPGTTIKTRDVIKALVVRSANDAATVAAEHIGGTEREFAVMMTRKARELGMTRTNFSNASGLPNFRQVSTARDMARLAVAIHRDFPGQFAYFSEKYFRWGKRNYRSHNSLLRTFPGTDGIKTGYTKASGFNLVASVERDGIRLVGVIFGGSSANWRDRRMRQLLTEQFAAAGNAAGIRQARRADRGITPPPRRPAPPETAKVAGAASPGNSGDDAAEGDTIAIAELPDPRPETPPPVIEPESAATPAPPTSKGGWGIRLGNFERRAGAHTASRDARHAARDIIGINLAKVEKIREGDKTFWRVVFDGFAEKDARRACASITRKGIVCEAVRA